MSFTYDPSHAARRDQARFYVGDTDPANPLLQDEEYDAPLERHTYSIALATILESLANRYSAYPDQYDESGRISVSWRERGKVWMQNATALRERGVGENVFAPQKDGIAVGEIAVDNTGYRPHANTGRRSWGRWRP